MNFTANIKSKIPKGAKSMNGQNDQNNQSNRQPSTLSGGEKFVAINLLSKIGTVFVIASVIAFSAASEGHIPDVVRLILVLMVGLIMLIAGELFRRKGSEIFANSMIYGGVAELMICAPIGQNGLGIFDTLGMLVYSTIAAAVGFGLAWRYRSQGLAVVMTAATLIPAFTAVLGDETSKGSVFVALPIFLILTHFANAVISRRLNFKGSFITGIWRAAIDLFFVGSTASDGISRVSGSAETAPQLFAVIFLIFCMVCYASAALLNAVEDSGEIKEFDGMSLYMSQGIVIFFAWAVFIAVSSEKLLGVILLVLALLYSLIVAAFSLKFRRYCKTNTVFTNLILICIEIAIFALFDTGNWEYIALHSFAAAVLLAGFFFERKLLKGWGSALLVIAEIRFLVVLAESGKMPESFKLSAAIVNLILWFGIMAVLGTLKKTRESAWFRWYSFAALMNAGLVCSNLISDDLMTMLHHNGALRDKAQSSAFSGLLCAAVWMILGFIGGKLPNLKKLKAPASITHYAIGFCCLGYANFANMFSNVRDNELVTMLVIATVIVNVVSVMAVLDITLQIQEKASKFSRAVGLIVSAYAMITLTTILGTNNVVKFTSCIISILYLALAAAWIIIGFWKNNPLLRRFGLALALFSSAKLFLFDFRGVDAFGRTLLFIGFGITLLGISFGYAVMEKKLSRRENPPEPDDKKIDN